MTENGEKITQNISYILQFIDNTRFIGSSLSSLANNLSEGIQRIKRKYKHNDEKWETCVIKYDIIATVFVNIQILKTIEQNTNFIN